MQTLWKLSQDGNSASRTLDNGNFESRLIIAIPEDELATALPADPVIPSPNGASFIASVKIAMGGILGSNALMAAYPAFLPAVQQSDWEGVQELILDAQTRAIINPTQYQSIKAAALSNAIPLTLP